jgi:hypothetical protein
MVSTVHLHDRLGTVADTPGRTENRTEAVRRGALSHAAHRSRHLLALLSMLCLFVVG